MPVPWIGKMPTSCPRTPPQRGSQRQGPAQEYARTLDRKNADIMSSHSATKGESTAGTSTGVCPYLGSE